LARYGVASNRSTSYSGRPMRRTRSAKCGSERRLSNRENPKN